MNITDSYLFAQRDPMGDGSSGTDRKGKGRSTPRPAGDMLALDLDAAESGTGQPNGGGGAFMQMELVEQQARPALIFSYACANAAS